MISVRWRTCHNRARRLAYFPPDNTAWGVVDIYEGFIRWQQWQVGDRPATPNDLRCAKHLDKESGAGQERSILLSLQKYNWMFIDPITTKDIFRHFNMPLIREDHA